jgi:hypothetical protein
VPQNQDTHEIYRQPRSPCGIQTSDDFQAAVTGKAVWFVSYDPRMGEGKDLFIKKFKPTPEEIKVVEDAAEQFLAECDALFDFYNNKAVYFDKD